MNNKLHSLEIEHQELSDHELETVVGGRGKYRNRSFSYNYTFTGSNSPSNSSFVVTRFGNADFVVSSSNNNNNTTTSQ